MRTIPTGLSARLYEAATALSDELNERLAEPGAVYADALAIGHTGEPRVSITVDALRQLVSRR
jgi:hypothetical protein